MGSKYRAASVSSSLSSVSYDISFLLSSLKTNNGEKSSLGTSQFLPVQPSSLELNYYPLRAPETPDDPWIIMCDTTLN